MIVCLPLNSLQVTNQCVVVCELQKWNGAENRPHGRLLRGRRTK